MVSSAPSQLPLQKRRSQKWHTCKNKRPTHDLSSTSEGDRFKHEKKQKGAYIIPYIVFTYDGITGPSGHCAKHKSAPVPSTIRIPLIPLDRLGRLQPLPPHLQAFDPPPPVPHCGATTPPSQTMHELQPRGSKAPGAALPGRTSALRSRKPFDSCHRQAAKPSLEVYWKSGPI